MSVSASATFKIGLDEHVTTAGATGTGKSHGTMLMMRAQRKPFIVYDSKASGTVLKFADRLIQVEALDDAFFEALDSIGKTDPYEKVAVRPRWDATEQEIRDLCNGIARWCYLRQNIGLYIDEVSDVCRNAQDAPSYVSGISRRGRERNVTLWATTQRPVGVPKILMSEASHFFVYQLRDPGDRDRIAQACEQPIQSDIQALPKRNFLYVNAADGTVNGPYKFSTAR